MIVLAYLAAGVTLLYFWLAGHWFARILVFLPTATLISVAIIGSANRPVLAGTVVVGALLGFALAWGLSSLPTWFWRRRMRAISLAEMRPLKAA